MNAQAINASLIGVSLILQKLEQNIAMRSWREILGFECGDCMLIDVECVAADQERLVRLTVEALRKA